MKTETKTCTHAKAERRDEALCGTCYGKNLLVEPLPVVRQVKAIDLSRGLSGRDEHYTLPT